MGSLASLCSSARLYSSVKILLHSFTGNKIAAEEVCHALLEGLHPLCASSRTQSAIALFIIGGKIFAIEVLNSLRKSDQHECCWFLCIALEDTLVKCHIMSEVS